MIELSNIRRMYGLVNRATFREGVNLEYGRLTAAITKLADMVAEYPGETDDWLYLGEFSDCALCDYLPGAYWHYTEWHGGQWSDEYAALCAIGRVFSPGMTSGPEQDTGECMAYDELNIMAEAFSND